MTLPDSGPESDGMGAWQITVIVVAVALFFGILLRHFLELWGA